MKYFVFAICCAIILTFAACGAGTDDNMSSQHVGQVTHKHPDLHTNVSERAKQLATHNERIDDATAVATDKELSIAVKVSNFNRFRLKSIRQDIHSRLSNHFPKYSIYVTTDSKLFSELQKMEHALKGDKPPKKAEIEKKLKKINEDMQG